MTPVRSNRDQDEAAIRRVIEARRIAWNSGDAAGYARLLTPDADVVSGTGRCAYGRDELVGLYVEQRAGVYRAASLKSATVTRIKFVRPDVAIADTEFELDGVGPHTITGINTFVLTREAEGWLISSIHGSARSPISAAAR